MLDHRRKREQMCCVVSPHFLHINIIVVQQQRGGEYRENTKANKMDLTIEGWNGVKETVELGEDDTPAVMRRKVASAVGLPEDGFCMSFGDETMGEGYDMTQLSAGDTIILTKTQKYEAIAALHALGVTDITEERLEKVDDPEVACLLLQAEVATVIPDDFLGGTSLTRLDLSAVSIVIHIGSYFLYDCTSLTSINLSGLINVRVIGYNFLSGCSGLTTLDLSSLSNLTEIGSEFAFGCSSLTTLDLSPLSHLTKLANNFLSCCSGLTTLDLSPLSNLTEIEYSFLAGCKGLTTLDLTPLSNLTRISHRFLNGCLALTTLDLSPLSSVRVVGTAYFVANCTSLKSIYLTGCSSAVSDAVVVCKLSELVVEARPKRSRDESPQQAHKRQRTAQ